MITEVQSAQEFISALNEQFGIDKLRIDDYDNYFVVMLLSQNNNVWVGRYYKSTQTGVIRDRRGSIRNEGSH